MQNKFEIIANTIDSNGYVILTDFINTETLNVLSLQCQKIAQTDFKKAGIGKNNNHQINSEIRSDQIYWIQDNKELPQEYLDNLESLRLALNQKLFLGLFDFECHFAQYSKGTFYKKHIDAFKGVGLRVLSSILYLNPDWKPGDGGELNIYAPSSNTIIETITPTFGKQVFFLSEMFPHEVLETLKPRQSLTGWFRINPKT
jgi:SM-20-related protein